MDQLSGLSLEELRALVATEASKQQTELKQAEAHRAALQDLLATRQRQFQQTITKMTMTKVEMGELLNDYEDLADIATSSSLEGEGAENGGSDHSQPLDPTALIDRAKSKWESVEASIPEHVEQALQQLPSLVGSGKSVVGALLEQLDIAAHVEGSKAPEGNALPPHVTPAQQDALQRSLKLSNLFFVSSNEVRGTRAWSEKHRADCKACQTRFTKIQAATGTSVPPKGATGAEALPSLCADSRHRVHRLQVQLTQEPSLSERSEEEHSSVDIARVAVILKIQEVASSSSLSDPKATCKVLQEKFGKLVQSTFREGIQKILESSAFNASVVPQALKVATEVLLASLKLQSQVTVVQQTKECTFIRFQVQLQSPVHVRVLDPFTDAVHPEQWNVLKEVQEQLLDVLTTVVGLEEGRAASLQSLANRVLDVILRSRSMLSAQLDEATGSAMPQQLYNVLQSLAISKSAITLHTRTVIEESETKQSSSSPAVTPSEKAIQLLRGLLQRFCAPSPAEMAWAVPPSTLSFDLRCERLPTAVLEVLNRHFTSDERVPSSHRHGVLDTVFTPRQKIALGLSKFSDLIVEVFRPYHKSCGGTVVEVESEAKSFFGPSPTLAPPCVSRTDLPIELVKMNARVHERSVGLLQQVERLAQRQLASNIQEWTQKVKAKVTEGAEELRGHVQTLEDELSLIGLQIHGFHLGEFSLMLPFGMEDMPSTHTLSVVPLLYATVSFAEY